MAHIRQSRQYGTYKTVKAWHWHTLVDPVVLVDYLLFLLNQKNQALLRLIDSFITQLKAQRPSRTCNGSKEGEEEARVLSLTFSSSL